MKSLFAFLRRSVPWLVVAFMLVTILRTALAGPSTTPREEDRLASDRVLEQAEGTVELRLQRPEGEWIGGLGVIEPASPERQLASTSAGRIVSIPVKEGDFVEQGTVLVELDAAFERAALAGAEAEVTTAELELTRIRGSTRTADLDALRRESEAAGVRAAQSRSTYDRLQQTAGSGGVSADELDRSRRQAEQDDLAARAAENRRASAESARPLDVRVAQARLDSAIARRDQAAASVDQKQIVAPIAGQILEILFDEGEYVQPGGAQPTVVLGDTRTLRARIDVDERDIDEIQQGGLAIITVDSMPGRRFQGTIVSIGRRMGRKNVRSDEPTERIDTKILEVVVDLGPVDLIVGQRVMAYLQKPG